MKVFPILLVLCWSLILVGGAVAQTAPDRAIKTETLTQARLFPLADVRLLPSPFMDAAAANRKYLLDLDGDRLLAPFLREAGLQPKKQPYPNWESQGLDGHTAGHYLSALTDLWNWAMKSKASAVRKHFYRIRKTGRFCAVA